MQAKYEVLNVKDSASSFLAFRKVAPKFRYHWHYHPEFEITFIEKGNGLRMIGDSCQNFEEGDLVLVGKGLPHAWAPTKIPDGKPSVLVIQFNEDILDSFLKLPEFEPVQNLLSRSKQGLFFSKKNLSSVTSIIKTLPQKTGVEKTLDLLQILNRLTQQKFYTLSSPYFHLEKGEVNERRIATVCQYIQENSGNKIILSEVAELIHLSESAFCKFFKKATGKTLSDYVNEVRVVHACHLLAESDKTIADVCYTAGFESLTYFNRVFLRKKGIRPKEFRNKRY